MRSSFFFRRMPLLAASALLLSSTARAEEGVLARAGARYARYRVTLDAGDLAAAEALVERGLSERPDDLELGKLRLRLLLPHHRFAEMIEGARALLARHPGDPDLDETLGDASLDLGSYEEAFAAYERFAAARPSAASWSRIALARAVTPDLPGAVAAMDLAAESARASDPEAFAWCRAHAARMLLRLGSRDAAAGRLVEAFRALPGHPASLAVAAEVAAREGRLAEACALAERSLEAAPDLGIAAAVVDYREAMRDEPGKERALDFVRTLERLLPEEERETSRSLARFEAERGDAQRALSIARNELAGRKDVWGWDSVAWAAFRSGKVDEALHASGKALARGTIDPLIEYHAGVIAAAAGRNEEGAGHLKRALTLDPVFHVVHAERARRLLASLTGGTR